MPSLLLIISCNLRRVERLLARIRITVIIPNMVQFSFGSVEDIRYTYSMCYNDKLSQFVRISYSKASLQCDRMNHESRMRQDLNQRKVVVTKLKAYSESRHPDIQHIV
jgi:hypothetical protein